MYVDSMFTFVHIQAVKLLDRRTQLQQRAYTWYRPTMHISVARGGQRGHALPTFLENIVILCFERRFLNKIVLFA